RGFGSDRFLRFGGFPRSTSEAANRGVPDERGGIDRRGILRRDARLIPRVERRGRRTLLHAPSRSVPRDICLARSVGGAAGRDADRFSRSRAAGLLERPAGVPTTLARLRRRKDGARRGHYLALAGGAPARHGSRHAEIQPRKRPTFL